MEVVTEADLERLPKDQRDLIKTYERSINAFVAEWEKLKRSGSAQLEDENRRRKLDLIRGAKEDLVGIINFLQSRGFYLEDHYSHVRHLVHELGKS
jgi:predicted lipoprotein